MYFGLSFWTWLAFSIFVGVFGALALTEILFNK